MSANLRDELLADTARKLLSDNDSKSQFKTADGSTSKVTVPSRAQYLTEAARRSDEEEFATEKVLLKKKGIEIPTSKEPQTDQSIFKQTDLISRDDLGSQAISFEQYKIFEDDDFAANRRDPGPTQTLKLQYESVIESRSPYFPNTASQLLKQGPSASQDWRDSLQQLAPSTTF